jgi:hypothetical protein
MAVGAGAAHLRSRWPARPPALALAAAAAVMAALR